MKKNLFGPAPTVDAEKAKTFAKDSQVANSSKETGKTTKPAEKPAEKKSVSNDYPWNAPDVRSDVNSNMLIALKEPTKKKLEWLAENNHIKSMRAFAIEILTAEIDKQVEKATKGSK